MARATYVMRGGELVLKRQAAPLPSGPIVIADGIDHTWHPADGKHYDSKSQFRRVTKSHGCEEIGNERQVNRQPYEQVSKADVKRAIDMVSAGYRPNVLPESLD